MKLIIRDFLASLKERDELDAILPDLLSELGFTVFSRPGRGTTQHGVDIAAVGNDEDGERKVFLLSVKQGNLTRQDWDGTPQSLRPSLNEIMDAYIPSRIPKRYEDLKVVICLCLGGDIQEQVRSAVSGFTQQNSNERISFDEWNGDKIAGLLLRGILREKILPKSNRTSFQKAVAMVDEPDVAYRHFADLVHQLCDVGESSQRSRVRVARQLYVCLWVLFVWARDAENVDAPYRASELVLLNVWHLQREFIGKRNTNARAITRVLNQLISLHLIISEEHFERKIFPHVEKRHAISMAVESQNPADVNLKLFDLLGRISMFGLWMYWFANEQEDELAKQRLKTAASKNLNYGLELINNNPTLFLPICDQNTIEICLFLLLALYTDRVNEDIANWLGEMVNRFDLMIRTHGLYPCVFVEYRDLVEHPRENSDEYQKNATSGSILIPTVAAWLTAIQDNSSLRKLSECVKSKLEHCTLQLWLPDKNTEEGLYIGRHGHGLALCDLQISDSGKELLETIFHTCEEENSFEELSSYQTGYWPLILLACRHYRHPVPPHFWVSSLWSEDRTNPAQEI